MGTTGRPFRTTRRVANLREGRNDWYRIENTAAAAVAAQVHIYDEIGFFGVTAADFVRDLAAAAGDLDVHLNCPGGDVFEAVAIYNALAQRPGTVSVYIDGLAASAASFIAQAASPGRLVIAENASMMIHDAFGMGIGNAADMRQLADLLDAQSENIASIYAKRSGRPAAGFRDAMRAETWYVGPAAVAAGLADAVQGGQGPQASFDLSVFAPRAGGSYDSSPWDGAAAMAGCTSAADYRAICAGEHTAGSPDERQHWALPHHAKPGAAPNRAGVNAALSRLPQTQDLADAPAARSHLEAHAKLWAPDGDGDEGSPANLHTGPDGFEYDADLFLSLLKEAST